DQVARPQLVEKAYRQVALKGVEQSPDDDRAQHELDDVRFHAEAVPQVGREKTPHYDVEHRPVDHVGNAIDVSPRFVRVARYHRDYPMCFHPRSSRATRRNTSSSAGSSRSSLRIA